PRELRFHCSCSRERSESALRSIDPGELRAIVEEQGGNIEVDCQFCGRRYLFDRVDVESLVHEGQHGPDSLQ
ncbi:Hsp33 family molecular chaperone HslO, partial [Acinetobacter baumannii]